MPLEGREEVPKRSEKKDAVRAEYIARRQRGEKVNLHELAQEFEVAYNLLRRWHSVEKWGENVPKKKGGQPGNKNAKGNNGGAPAGNCNAEKDGAYSRFFFSDLNETEREALELVPLEGVAALEQEMLILKAREKRIFDKITFYENQPEDALYQNGLTDMRVPGGRGEKKRDGAEQQMGMYVSESAFSRALKLQDALNRVQGRITAVSNALRMAEEARQRSILERERMKLAWARATGAFEVPDAEDEDEAPWEDEG